MQITDFRNRIKENVIITDGALGTYYEQKYHTQEAPELANEINPNRILEIHKEYIEAGANIIRTNTFASNSVSLGRKFDEQEKTSLSVKSNIIEAIKIAREAVAGREDIFISGDIGPIPERGFVTSSKIEQEYYDIARTFVDNGIHIINFETFSNIDAIVGAIKRIKAEANVFVAVTFTVNQLGYSEAGLSAKYLLGEASEVEEIDGIGLNCGIGPYHMCEILGKISVPKDKVIVALPNAGYPVLSRERTEYVSQPVYFAQRAKDIIELGVDIVGGCCGTNPEFTKEMRNIINVFVKPERKDVMSDFHCSQSIINHGFMFDEQGNRKQKKMIAVELVPPFDTNDEKLLESAHYLNSLGVDVLTFPDSPSGRTRVDSVLMASKVHRETGIDVMPHICCRDKNALAMRSTFMGAKINGIDNFLIITGDPVPVSARDTVKQVFNFSSVGLMKIVQEMNEESFAGAPICYGGAINQNRVNIDSVVELTKKKMNAGARFFLTQPIFSKEEAEKIRHIKEETGATIFCGIMPLVSRRNAMFMKNEIVGINVTDEIVERYPENGTKEMGEEIGIALGREIITYVEDFADGYYFSIPFNRVYLLKKILKQ